MEIEQKYLIKEMPANLLGYEVKRIEQGYLCTGPVVRIRQSNDRYILTYKNHVFREQESSHDVRVNQEIEAPLTKESYQHLKEKVDYHLVTKDRYLIPLKDGHTAELDIFHGILEGLSFVEVEFESEEDVSSFVKPDWFGENVSADKRYSNSYLSKCEDLSAFDSK